MVMVRRKELDYKKIQNFGYLLSFSSLFYSVMPGFMMLRSGQGAGWPREAVMGEEDDVATSVAESVRCGSYVSGGWELDVGGVAGRLQAVKGDFSRLGCGIRTASGIRNDVRAKYNTENE